MTADLFSTSMIVFAPQEPYAQEAAALACRLGIPFTCSPTEAKSASLLLRLDENGLALVCDGTAMRGEFSARRLLPNHLNGELLVRAVKMKGVDRPLFVADATAGLGEDSLLLAAAGHQVRLYEYNPVIAALLADTLRRAAGVPELAPIAARMTLQAEDSITALPTLSPSPDVVLLDPMFPERQKSGLVKKKFQLLHLLELPCDRETELMAAAIAAHPQKIVVKRPLKAPFLAGRKPSYSLCGKSIRYDCLVLPQP